MRKVTVALILNFIASPAYTAPPSSRYYCKDEAAGGISYDKNSDSYVGTRFKTQGSFILSLDRGPITKNGVATYNVRITETGSSESLPCYDRTTEGRRPYLTFSNRLQCESMLQTHLFDFSTNKYLKTYMFGYIDNIKDNSNTPSITGGVCTSID